MILPGESSIQPANGRKRRNRERTGTMKVKVDSTLCAASANCVSVCPQVFRLVGEVSEVKVDVVPSEHESACRQAADQCPTGAISIEE